MTMIDPDVIPQVVQYEDNRNCACCQYWEVVATAGYELEAYVWMYCRFAGGPQWGDEKHEHPYPPGKTCCQLFRDKVLL